MGVDVGTKDREAGEYVTSVMKYAVTLALSFICLSYRNFVNCVGPDFQNVRHLTLEAPTTVVPPRIGVPVHEIREGSGTIFEYYSRAHE